MGRILVSYGCGEDGKSFLKHCRENNITIDYICDSNTDIVGKTICGYEVMSADYLREDDRDKPIIIASRKYYYEILESIKLCQNSVFLSIDDFFFINRCGAQIDYSSYNEEINNKLFFEELTSYINKGKICLFADSCILETEKNAGAKASYCYIKALVKKGWNVIFYSSLANYLPKDAKRIEQLGCFVLWGYNRKKLILDFISKNMNHIELCFINRPDVFKELDDYLDITKIPTIFFGHDIHYLRLQREMEISGDKNLVGEIERIKNVESNCINKALISGYPSKFEVSMLLQELPNSNIKYFPLYSFQDKELTEYDCNRSGLMFVGGFVHKPNVDAMRWFCEEVIPKIREAGVRDVFYIIGSNPTEEILSYASDDIEVVGFVSDEELETYYRKCRVAVIPLRYGAGMKGKLLEAMYKGIPVVTTSIGAEGLEDCYRCFEVADDAHSFANSIISIIDNQNLAKELSQNEQTYISNYFNEDEFASCLEGYI